mmetsp:Transcript_33368/g.54142  ORF Transcript_33368/g.54142 Transcript_33368/m.54142 type:complete len:723 (+) Transcript_33368:223-2391(+)|eukprot:CAMPEP_0184649102 /NCGR_PEP_ID=MMETSP0308-20130426/6342_1 /TAXON_ID=38269 /ORGANISM="Gloeochaete witrockiana, Strain SAG 46.84" /LENGTH=722 /DNA_ID=CAMNT_0027081505 /DNA_START=127 /DNA_END=2295 /DNA_ORIENTATION=+
MAADATSDLPKVEVQMASAISKKASISKSVSVSKNVSMSRPSMELHDFSSNTQPSSIHLDNVHYWVDVKKSKNPFDFKTEKKELLKGVSSYVEAGQLLAVMGPSGSGKSTLLDLIAGRKTLGTAAGQVYVNGEAAFHAHSDNTTISTHSKIMKKVSAYVVQDDSMFEFLAVSEVLQYFADLRMPPKTSRKDRKEKVEEVMAQLGLTRIKDSKIGGAFIRGISGGEKRRVSIACELLTSPPILFLDEPTSGLSSADAFVVVKILKNLTKRSHTVVTTIHQPSAEIYRMFDRLLLLARGEVVFSGKALEAVPYFERLGFVKDDVTSAAEFVLKVVTPGFDFGGSAEQAQSVKKLLGSAPTEPSAAPESNGKGVNNDAVVIEMANKNGTGPERVEQQLSEGEEPGILTEDEIHGLAEVFKADSIGQHSSEVVASVVNGTNKNLPPKIDMSSDSSHNASPGRQMWVLALRNLTLMSRNPNEVFATVMQGITVGIILGTLLRGANGQPSNFLQVQGIFIILLMINYSYFQALSHFIYERSIINRESAGNLYGKTWWFLSRVLTSIPFYSVALLPFGVIYHGFMEFRYDAFGWGFYVLMIIIFSNVTAAVTEFVAAISPDFANSVILSNFIMGISFMFGGFLVPRQSVPAGWTWAYYISYFTYAFSGMMVNQFELQPLDDNNPLVQFGLQPEYFLGKVWNNFGMLIAIYVVYRFLTLLALKYLHKERR